MKASDKIDDVYVPKDYLIESIKKETEDTFIFKVRCDLDPKPGQFVEVSMPYLGECPISIASNDSEYIELLIRKVGSVTNAIFKLNKDDTIGIRGSYGHGYPMKDFKGKDIIIIAGGTGTAPPMGMLKYIKKKRDKYERVRVFLGFKSPQDILFREDIESLKKEGFEINLTVDRADDTWKRDVGLITSLMEKHNLETYNTVVICCGPPIMIKYAIEQLLNRNFSEDQIYVSHERHMKCGIGKCGHCMIHGKYVCKDGPVFRYDKVKDVGE